MFNKTPNLSLPYVIEAVSKGEVLLDQAADDNGTSVDQRVMRLICKMKRFRFVKDEKVSYFEHIFKPLFSSFRIAHFDNLQ